MSTNFVFALHGDGTVSGYGSNSRGQLGLVNFMGVKLDTVASPTVIPGLHDVKDIAVGEEHTLVLHHDGTMSAMGKNGNGQLGLGDREDRHVPTRLSVFGIGQILASGDLSAALTAGAPRGFFSPPAPRAAGVPSALVLPCPAGTFGLNDTMGSCLPCPRGTYSSAVAARAKSTCVKCIGMLSTANAGATRASDCSVCPPNMARDGSLGRCGCAPGRFGAPLQSDSCPECACTKCSAGKFATPLNG